MAFYRNLWHALKDIWAGHLDSPAETQRGKELQRSIHVRCFAVRTKLGILNQQTPPLPSSLSSNTLSSPPMDEPNGGVPQRPATSAATASESLKGFWQRINCCNDDPSNPCRPRSIHQSGYWLLIAMVLCAFVMVLPFLKGHLHLISAYTNLLLFACIFGWRTPESIGVMAAAAVVLANALFGAAMYGHYASRFNDNNHCDVLLVVGLRSQRNDKFCFEDSFPIISLVCGLAWLIIGGCLLRFVELRRAELLLAGNTSPNAGGSSTSGIAATAPPRPQPPLQEPVPLHSIINRRLPRHSNGGGMA